MIRHLFSAILGVAAVAPCLAQTPQPTTAPYIIALEQITTLEKGSDEELIDADAPLDDRTAQFLSRNEKIFVLMHDAVVNDEPEWSATSGDVNAVVPSLNPLRSMANLATLHAKMQFKNHQHAEAVASLMDVKAFARNISRTEPTMIGQLVAIGIDALATDELARILPPLPAEVVRALPEQIKRLPAPIPFPELLRGERRFGAAMLAKSVGGDAPKIAGALGPFYDEIAKAWEQSPPLSSDDFRKALSDAVAKMDGKKDAISVALTRPLLPSFVAFYQVSRMQQVKQAMLEAGVVVVRDGPNAVKSTTDPLADGPFGYEKRENGFELRSALVGRDGTPISMKFGAP